MRLTHLCMALTAVVVAGLFSPALAQIPPPATTSQSAAGSASTMNVGESTSGGYVVGRDDVIEVKLIGGADYGGRVRVQADGSIELPMIGKVQAAEHTTAELSQQIRNQLKAGGYFADPIVSVEVVAYSARYVTVLGAVGTPGLVPMNRAYRISEILAKVGGVREGAADYIVLRSEKGEEKHLAIRDLATGDLTQDPYVLAGDKIYAPLAETFYIYGQVKGPGGFALMSGMTVRQAIARGGGLTDSGSDKKVQVTRAGKKMKLKLDDKVEPGDVLVVGERLF